MQATLAAVSDREVVLEGRHGRKLYFEQLEVKVTPLASIYWIDAMYLPCVCLTLHAFLARITHLSCTHIHHLTSPFV